MPGTAPGLTLPLLLTDENPNTKRKEDRGYPQSSLLHRFCSFFYILLKINYFVIIFFIHIQRSDHEICGSSVNSHGNIIDLGNPHQGFYIWVMGLSGK